MRKLLPKILITTILSTSIFMYGQPMTVNADQSQDTYMQQITRNSISKTGKIKPCDFLNIRSGAGSNYSVLGKVYTNDVVTILETSSNGWHKIRTTAGLVGWSSGAYITIQNNITTSTNTQNSDKVNKLLEVANKQIGKPYAWGASGPNSFDCSGFTYYVYKTATGVNLPRTSREQAKVGTKVERKDLKPGDLVFFNTGGSGISHVGMYIGNNNFIHSTQPGDTVKIHSINSSYYSRTFVTARRVIS